MGPSDHRGTRSTAAIFGHPIHPMLVVFPIGFVAGALATDLAFWATRDPFWARASEWLLGAGIVMGALAAVAGLIEFVTISRVRSLAAGWVHFLGNAAAILNALWLARTRFISDLAASTAIEPARDRTGHDGPREPRMAAYLISEP